MNEIVLEVDEWIIEWNRDSDDLVQNYKENITDLSYGKFNDYGILLQA